LLSYHFSQLLGSHALANMWNKFLPVGFSLMATGVASSKLLYVTSYAGTLTTLKLNLPRGYRSGSLQTLSTTLDCGPFPSWVTLDEENSVLYCSDEGWGSPTGYITSFATSADGQLALVDRLEVLSGAVTITPYGNDGRGLAIPHYSTAGVSSLSASASGELGLLQNETYTLDGPGTDPVRQEAPHPHDAIIDPTGRFVLVPDLGADLVRVFQVDPDDLTRTALEPLAVEPGSGPRHGVFTPAGDKVYFYLLSELSNTITGYEVLYNDDAILGFEELFTISSHGEGGSVPAGPSAAEIEVSPDGNFLIVSSRNENLLTIPNFDPANSTEIASDPLITFSIDETTGSLTKVQEFPAGGSRPRHFSLNGDGSLVAVGLQGDSRVVVIERNVKTGRLGRYVAHATVAGEVSAVIFDESY
jgi:6-phosphogluconolactonase (cycloisomerase 2 family)